MEAFIRNYDIKLSTMESEYIKTKCRMILNESFNRNNSILVEEGLMNLFNKIGESQEEIRKKYNVLMKKININSKKLNKKIEKIEFKIRLIYQKMENGNTSCFKKSEKLISYLKEERLTLKCNHLYLMPFLDELTTKESILKLFSSNFNDVSNCIDDIVNEIDVKTFQKIKRITDYAINELQILKALKGRIKRIKNMSSKPFKKVFGQTKVHMEASQDGINIKEEIKDKKSHYKLQMVHKKLKKIDEKIQKLQFKRLDYLRRIDSLKEQIKSKWKNIYELKNRKNTANTQNLIALLRRRVTAWTLLVEIEERNAFASRKKDFVSAFVWTIWCRELLHFKFFINEMREKINEILDEIFYINCKIREEEPILELEKKILKLHKKRLGLEGSMLILEKTRYNVGMQFTEFYIE